MSRFIEGQDRQQVTLLPECLDESPRVSRRLSSSASFLCLRASATWLSQPTPLETVALRSSVQPRAAHFSGIQYMLPPGARHR